MDNLCEEYGDPLGCKEKVFKDCSIACPNKNTETKIYKI